MKKITDIVYSVIVFILILIAAVVAASTLNIPGGIKLYTVQSGSMEPSIHTGSIVISKPFDNYQKGDVITFRSEKDKDIKVPKSTVTHRINEVKTVDGKEVYVTKGDANNTPDTEPTSKDLVLGKVIFAIPLLGFPVSFAKTQNGLIILIVVPATLIVYSELISIKNEVKKLIEKRKKRKLNIQEKIELEIGEEEIKAEKGIKKLFRKIFKQK